MEVEGRARDYIVGAGVKGKSRGEWCWDSWSWSGGGGSEVYMRPSRLAAWRRQGCGFEREVDYVITDITAEGPFY